MRCPLEYLGLYSEYFVSLPDEDSCEINILMDLVRSRYSQKCLTSVSISEQFGFKNMLIVWTPIVDRCIVKLLSLVNRVVN